MICRCGATFEPTAGRGRSRVRCQACASDKSALAKAWRAANPSRVAAHNATRRADYAAAPELPRARANLRYALKVNCRIADAQRALDAALARAK